MGERLETARNVVREVRCAHSAAHVFRMGVYAAVAGVHSVTRSADGIDVPSADWQNLLVLDACRSDLFEETVDTDQFDDYREVTSKGSMTAEWVQKNFTDEYGDVVYVTANPHVAVEAGEKFHALVEVYAHEDNVDDLGTVRPGPLVEATREAADRYPDKRLVVHFMQPHHPFVEAPELHEYSNWDVDAALDGNVADGMDDPFVALAEGLVDRDTVWEAYRENLEYVLDDAVELARSLPGRSVITSDHGNMLGTRMSPFPVDGYGHPPGIRLPELVEVPWAVFEGEDVDTSDGGVQSSMEATDDTVEDRLEALGYA